MTSIEPALAVIAALLLAAVGASKLTRPLGVPVLLLFIGIGMVAGSEGFGGIEFTDFELAQSVGITALAFILFAGGLDTDAHLQRVRDTARDSRRFVPARTKRRDQIIMPMAITIREQPLPGVGKRYEIDLSETRQLHVVATRDGGRWLGVAEAHDEDPPIIELSREQATMLGALLLGARFSVDVAADADIDGDIVIVETVTVPDGAPSVGRRPSEVLREAPHSAQVLGVIRHQTPEIVEPDRDAPLRIGDEVALAARSEQIAGIRDLLTGRNR